MRFARIADGQVAEVLTLPDDADVGTMFHRDIVAALVPCPDTAVDVGWTYAAGAFRAPAPSATEPPEPPEPPPEPVAPPVDVEAITRGVQRQLLLVELAMRASVELSQGLSGDAAPALALITADAVREGRTAAEHIAAILAARQQQEASLMEGAP